MPTPAPLAGADLEAEHALGEDREDHDAGGEHGLDDGQRREGERGDVQDPGPGGDGHADGEPPARKSFPTLDRPADVDARAAQAPRCL